MARKRQGQSPKGNEKHQKNLWQLEVCGRHGNGGSDLA